MKVALGSKRMTVEAAQYYTKNRKEWRALVHMYMIESTRPFLLVSCLPSDGLPGFGGGSHGEGCDAVTL